MTRLDALPPDDTTPESQAWEEWAGKLSEGDTVEVIEGGYAGHRGRVELIDEDYVAVRLIGDTLARVFSWDALGPVQSVRGRQ